MAYDRIIDKTTNELPPHFAGRLPKNVIAYFNLIKDLHEKICFEIIFSLALHAIPRPVYP